MSNHIKVGYRDIAKMFCSAMPIEGKDFGDKVNEYLDIIKRMPAEAKVALKSAYIFSRKVPREEREDLFQELCLAVLQVKTKDEKLGYAIARCDWRNWWQKFYTRQHYLAGSLNDTVLDSENQPVEFAELIVGEVEFERKIDGKMDAERIYQRLPDTIRPIINNRLIGKALNAVERQRLSRYIKKEGYKLLLA